jgi:hypothetical protein
MGNIRRTDCRAWWKIAATLALLMILFARSAWMLATIPPLWKDIDAYGQVTGLPNPTTILLYGPAYGFLARIPLYIGYAYDCLRAGGSLPSFAFFAQPTLTDSGVFALLLIQHLALCVASSLLIMSATPFFIARVIFAIFWASIPIYYVWAHCVGTESLSLILLLVIATVGLRIVKAPRRVPVRRWLVFGILFTVSMLTRHINGVLGALLPLSFGVAAVFRFIVAWRQKSPQRSRCTRMRGLRDFRHALFAIAVGLVCIAASSLTMRLLSRAAAIPYHSTVGFTFMFRLRFFASLTPAERDEVVKRAVPTSQSEEMRILLDVFRSVPYGTVKLDVMSLLLQARALLPPDALRDDNFDRLLNQTVRAFLVSPSGPFLRAAAADFAKSQASTLAQVIASPFVHTAFFFTNAEWMPGCASLLTFRENNAAKILGLLKAHSYLKGWRKFSYRKLLLVWLVLLLVFVYFGRARSIAISSYAAALTLAGLLMMIANCLLNEYQSRYTLPMWELLIVSATIVAGAATKLLQRMARAKGLETVLERGRIVVCGQSRIRILTPPIRQLN